MKERGSPAIDLEKTLGPIEKDFLAIFGEENNIPLNIQRCRDGVLDTNFNWTKKSIQRNVRVIIDSADPTGLIVQVNAAKGRLNHHAQIGMLRVGGNSNRRKEMLESAYKTVSSWTRDDLKKDPNGRGERN